MTPRAGTEIDRLFAPANDGEVLIYPRATELPGIAQENRRLRASWKFALCGRPIQSWFSPAIEQAPLLILSGHQPDFFHPGVWAKNIFAANLASRCEARAEMLLVDSDIPDNFSIAWPQREDEFWTSRSTPICPACVGLAYEQLKPLPRDYWRKGLEKIPASLREDAARAFPGFESGFLDNSAGNSNEISYISGWISGMTKLDQNLGLTPPQFNRVSKIFSVRSPQHIPAASAFVAHMVLNAEAFAEAYNAALASFRAARGIRGTQHPIPNLTVDSERIELPLWVFMPDAQRQRLYVARGHGASRVIFAGRGAIATLDAALLTANPTATLATTLGLAELRPRALILTMYARLIACDLFIHGIGGAKYDQITDEIIRRYMGIQPPTYACVTATMRLPLPRFDVDPSELQSLHRQLRDLTFNPQRIDQGKNTVTSLGLLAQRREAVEQSEQLRTTHRRDRAARRTAFNRIRQINAQLSEPFAGTADAIRARIAALNAELDSNAIADAREWFLALYPLAKLRALAETLHRT